ncbi:MAG TPA: TetR/AcrR family transcriptional regulator [Solirubrobacteraceae bacterium]|jgi:AcrR family transcriptional regulator|nr:TetR/AcrR family transcriptional regulator [Solirubrobacteraceae bacterium]
MLLALVEVAGERGVAQASVAHIVARAGVSRRTFYELFEDREDCFLAAFDHALARARETVVLAYESERGWRERIRAGLAALLQFLDEEPGLGGLLIVDSLSAGPRALERRGLVLDVLLAVVDAGREEGRAARERPALAAEGVVGGVFSVVHARMLRLRAAGVEGARARAGELPFLGLLNQLMGMIVMPYLGTAAAKRELKRPVPAVRAVRRAAADPLRDLDMRLTYRTIRVLVAIAEASGASNRRIAEAAGVSDQGQISKLLTRLEHLGLIQNAGEGPAKGEPNAWTLTETGAEVERAIRTETGSPT